MDVCGNAAVLKTVEEKSSGGSTNCFAIGTAKGAPKGSKREPHSCFESIPRNSDTKIPGRFYVFDDDSKPEMFIIRQRCHLAI